MNNETRTVKSLKNISIGFISKFVILILGFVDRKFFIEVLGEGMLSVNGLFTNILLVLSLAELGMTNVMVFSYYKPLAEKNYDKLNALTTFYKKIYNIIAIIVAIIGIILIPGLKYIINLSEPIENLNYIYLMFLANTVISYLFVYKSTILTADQNGYIASKLQIFFDVVRQILQIVILILTQNILCYLAVKVLFAFLYNYCLAKYVEKRYPFIKSSSLGLKKDEKQEILSTIKSGFIYKLAGVLLNGTDNIIISSVVGTIWIGYLTNYDTIFTSITAFVVVLFNSLTASLGNLNITASPQKRLEVFNIMLFSGFWISRILVPCFFFLSGDLVRIWLGERFILDVDILSVKLMMVYFTCTLNPLFAYREATGLYRKSKYVIFLGSMINIFLSILLGKYYGVMGVLLASIIAMLLTYVWYEPVILYKDYFFASSKDYFLKHIKNIILLLFSMAIVAPIMRMIIVESWSMLFVKAGICFLLVNVISLVLLNNNQEYQFFKNKGKSLVSELIKKG